MLLSDRGKAGARAGSWLSAKPLRVSRSSPEWAEIRIAGLGDAPSGIERDPGLPGDVTRLGIAPRFHP